MTKTARFALTVATTTASTANLAFPLGSTLIVDPSTGEISTPSTTREALIERYGLPANASEQDCMDAIQVDLCTKYKLPITATDDEINQKIHEASCARFHLDPTTTTEAQLDAHVSTLLLKRAA